MREEQARTRADARAPDEALLPDSHVLEESACPRMEVDDVQVAAQEAQLHARQDPTAVPAEISLGSGVQVSGASKREIESRELGDIHGC